MKDDDEAAMVCVDADAPHRLPGYQANCSECDKPIWVSNSSRELLTTVTQLICLQCYMKVADGKIEPPDPIQMEELSKYLTKEQIESISWKLQIINRMKKTI